MNTNNQEHKQLAAEKCAGVWLEPKDYSVGHKSLGTALLVTSDRRARELAPVWLGNAGFDVTIAETAEEAIRIVSEGSVSLTLADAAISIDDNRTLIRELKSLCGGSAPVMGLCANKAEVDLAHVSRAADAFEGPHDWQAISRCCVKMLSENDILQKLEEALGRLSSGHRGNIDKT